MTPAPQTSAGDRLMQLIGQRIDYYGPIFDRLDRDRRIVAWNWCAFAFGPVWALYRRMYVLAIAAVLLAQAIHYAPALWPQSAVLFNIPVWWALLFGVFGNRMLWLHTRRRVGGSRRIRPGPNRIVVWCLIGLYILAHVVARL